MRQFFIKYSKFNLRVTSLIILGYLVISCGGVDDPAPDAVVNNPAAATLVFPEENSECLDGSDKTATKSTIEFRWNSGLNTNSYKLNLKDLNTGVVATYSGLNTSVSVTLKRDNPYSWSVISISSSSAKTATSPVWKFFNAGDGVVSYAPFPAEITSPLIGAVVDNSLVSLDWSGSDVDGDIKSYDVYFGEAENPDKIEAGITESVLDNVAVISGKKYYWKIDTKDEVGNVSTSDVFYFKVK
jgi:hypothetical protein